MCEPYDPFDFPDLPDEAVVAKMRAESEELCGRYPVPGIE